MRVEIFDDAIVIEVDKVLIRIERRKEI